MGTVGVNPAVIRMFGSVSGAAVLAVAVRELVSGHRWQIMASPGSSVGAFKLVVPGRERQDMISRFHDSLFAGHLGVSRTIYHLQDRVYWPGLRNDVRSYIASIMYSLFGPEVSLSTKGPYGTC